MIRHKEMLALPSPKQGALLLGLGLAAGFLSGMFGVGGGILIVPGLIAIAHFNPRLAAGTSLTTIVPLAAVGVVSYAKTGHVSWVAALLLAAGAMVGSQIGTWLLAKISPVGLQLGFASFMIFSAGMLFVAVPSREATLQIGWGIAAALILVGLATGILSGLLGVGGGLIVVPALMLVFGASDLVAKGTSLMMMIPTALAGTIPNVARKNMNLPAALIVGLSACVTTFFGSEVAHRVTPMVANVCFSIFVVIIAMQLAFHAMASKRRH